MQAAIAVMKEAFAELSAGRVTMPTRAHIDVPDHAGTSLFMPSYAARFGKIGVKIVNVFGDNRAKGLPAIQGLVCLFDSETVSPVLERLQPQVHAKGTDYTVETVPEREVVAAYGGRTAICGDPKDHATTDLIGIILERFCTDK